MDSWLISIYRFVHCFRSGNTCVNSPATANAVAAIDPQMNTRWVVPTAIGVTDDDVGGGVLLVQNSVFINAKNGILYSIDANTGIPNWSKYLGAPDLLGGIASPGYVGGTLFASRGYTGSPYYVGPDAPGGALYGLTLAGDTKWTIETKQIVLGQVVGANGVAYAELDNTLDALDPETGKVLWSYTTGGNFGSLVAGDRPQRRIRGRRKRQPLCVRIAARA